jgi:hypothetical protein
MTGAVALRPEAWERAAQAGNRWLQRVPGGVRALRVIVAVCVLMIVVASAAVDGFQRGLRVWVPCVLMLLAWTALLVTRTVRWTSVLRLFTLASVWAVVVAWLSDRWSNSGFMSASSDGAVIAIAGIVEEVFKLLPLAVIATVAPGRARRFAIADWAVCGLACGMSFQAAEDFIRQASYEPGPWELLYPPQWAYGWTLFGGGFDLNGQARFAGHHLTTGLVAAGLGFAVHAMLRRRRGRWFVWLVPAVLLVLMIADHAAFNASTVSRPFIAEGASDMPAWIHAVWDATGNGYHRGWLLLVLCLIAMGLDARVLVPPQPWPSSLTRVERFVNATAQSVQTVARQVAARLRVIVATPVSPGDDRGWTHRTWSALSELRSSREHMMAVDSAAGRRVTRWGAVALGLLSAVAAQRYAVAVAADIGSLVGYEQAWFAGLLEALLDWWNGLGPGGQAMVGLGLLALFGGGMLILAPQVIIGTGVIGVTGAGTITSGAIVVPAAVTTAAGQVVVATGVAMVASGATSGDGETKGDGGSRDGDRGTQEDPGVRDYPADFASNKTQNHGAQFSSEGEARAFARQKVGSDPVKVGPNKLRSQDGRWQYRAKPGDTKLNHVHLERLDPRTGEVLDNWHLYWPVGG